MIATVTEPIVHNSPDRTDALALMCVGGAIVVIIAVLIVLADRANTHWAIHDDAKAEHDALVGRRTESWCRNWLDGRAADEARMVQRVREGKEHVRTWPPSRAKSTTRLADFAAEQKRKSA